MAPTKTISRTKASSSSILKLPLDTRRDPGLRHFNQLLYIPETGIWAPGKKSTPIFDYSSHFNRSAINWFTDDYIGINEDIRSQVKELAHTAISIDQTASDELQNPSVIFKLSRSHWYNDSKFTVTKPRYSGYHQRLHQDGGEEESAAAASASASSSRGVTAGEAARGESSSDGNPQSDQDELVLADYSSPLLAYGVTNITFPPNSLHSSHPITVKPINATRRTQTFVQDSVMYAWDVNKKLFPGGGGVLSLYKGVGASKRIEIGRYQSDNGKFVPGGVLVIDSDEVDVLVAVLSLLSVLSQRDSFSVPTGNWAAGIIAG